MVVLESFDGESHTSCTERLVHEVDYDKSERRFHPSVPILTVFGAPVSGFRRAANHAVKHGAGRTGFGTPPRRSTMGT
jgi:hypothetical protein